MDRRIFGLENEYGVTCTFRGSRRLSPDEVARYLFRRVVSWGRSSNVFLRNGARLYLDVGSHPAHATPECDSALDIVAHDKAGERILEGLLVDADRRLREEGIAGDICLFKNNTDSAGNSYGCHENYLVGRHGEFGRLADILIPFLVTRQIICGAGKVLQTPRGAVYCVSQRAEHIWEGVSSATTRSRPIINTRDEPHADAERFRRLHVIIGDANLSQVATLVKLGSTALLLAVLEDRGAAVFPSPPRRPVAAVRAFALDTTLVTTVACEDDRLRSAWDFQDQLWHLARAYVTERGGEAIGSTGEVELILRHWREMLDGVRDDADSVADRVEWVAKRRVVDGYRERHSLAAGDARLRAIDLQFHDLRPARSLAARVGLRPLFEVEEVREAVHNPPRTTRAFFRGRCVALFPDQIVAANWDSVVFDLGEGPPQRVPMMDPLRGTAVLTEDLLETSQTADDLLAALDG